MTRTHRLALIVVLSWLACQNPFATREAEEPTRERTNREIPTDPETVLRNMQNAVADMNVENYIFCFVGTGQGFRFTPDPLIKENNPGVFEAWTEQSERRYFTQLANALPADSLRRLMFDAVSREDFQDSVLLRRSYQLIVHHTYPGKVPRDVKGQADFWLIQRDGYWYIKRWLDFGTADTPNWSSIKAGFGK